MSATASVWVMVAIFTPRTAFTHDCEALGITGEELEAIEEYISNATTTVDIGLLVAGGLSAPLAVSDAEIDGLFHLALSGGMTYAIGMDVETYCSDPSAPMPPGLGWQVFVATNNFDDIEAGALMRYHGELNLVGPDILLELGGLHRWATEADDAFGALLSLGYGTQVLQLLAQGQYLFDDDSTIIAIAGVRFDAYLFRLLF